MSQSKLSQVKLYYENHDEYENISNMIRKAKLSLRKKLTKGSK